MSGYDTGLLVVSCGVTGKFEDLGSEVCVVSMCLMDKKKKRLTLEDGSEVDGGTGTDSLGVVSLLQQSVDTTDGDWLLLVVFKMKKEEKTYIEVRPWKIETKTWSRHQTFHLYHQQQKTLL